MSLTFLETSLLIICQWRDGWKFFVQEIASGVKNLFMLNCKKKLEIVVTEIGDENKITKL